MQQDTSTVVVENKTKEDLPIPLVGGGSVLLAPGAPIEITPQIPHIEEGLLERLETEGKITVMRGSRVCGFCSQIIRAPFPWTVKLLQYPPMTMCPSCAFGRVLWGIQNSHAITVYNVTPDRRIVIEVRDALQWMQFHGQKLDVIATPIGVYAQALKRLCDLQRAVAEGSYNLTEEDGAGNTFSAADIEEIAGEIRTVVEELTGKPFNEVKL